MKKYILGIVFVLSFQIFAVGMVAAEEKEYPEKPIKVILGLASGSITDVSSRALSKVALKYIDQPLVVVNMPGASFTVALNELVKSTPDGYTAAIYASSYRTFVTHMQKNPIDVNLLKMVLGFTAYRGVLFVKGDSPYVTAKEFIDFGRKHPGAIKFGHAGKGTGVHIQGELFFRSAKVQAADVPFKGSSEYVPAVIGGHVMCGVVDISAVTEHLRAGTLKAVVVFADKRLKSWPDIPTSRELGYADVAALGSLVGVCVHRDTPVDRVKKLHDALKKAVDDPEFHKILEGMGLEAEYMPPETFHRDNLEAEKIAIPLLKELKLFVQ